MIQKNKQKGKRTMGASLMVAALVLAGALLHRMSNGNAGLIWLTTAVYMLGPISAALIVWPLVKFDGWLFLTAVFLSLAIVVPWAFIDPSAWVASFLPQLGQWANVLVIVLLVSHVSAGKAPRGINWALTSFYLLILLGLPLLL